MSRQPLDGCGLKGRAAEGISEPLLPSPCCCRVLMAGCKAVHSAAGRRRMYCCGRCSRVTRRHLQPHGVASAVALLGQTVRLARKSYDDVHGACM
eukprot:145573-Chlamydomonas_euryale.AAC.4